MTTEEFKNNVIPYSRKLYPMLFRILKDEEETRDALQDLMVKLWNRKDELEKCSNQSAYIITVAKNYSFDLLKKKRPVAMDETQEFRMLNIESREPGIDIKERFEQVRSVINSLPEKYRIVIQMRDVDGFSFDEMKEVTGYEVANLRVILSRARQKVKEEVEKIYNYDTTRKFARQIL